MECVTLTDLISATAARAVACDANAVTFNRVTTDSRQVQFGDLFWAIEGVCHDGHDFIADAARKGAVACVIEQGKPITSGIPAAVVADTIQGLKDFARWYRQRRDALVVGVTGSVGKTTTREMIHAVVGASVDGCRSPKNYNNHIGLPLSVLEIKDSHRFAVLEMGASQVREIQELAAVASPEFGVVTRIGLSHLEGFGNIERIVQAKGELVEALPSGGIAVLNGDDPLCRGLAGRASCRVVTVGEGIDNTFRAARLEVAGPELRFRVDGAAFCVRAAGRHHLTAALASIAIAREWGLSSEQIAEGFLRFTPVAGRCQVHELDTFTLIDDSYNANPSSMEAACRLLGEWKRAGERVLVVGDMAELGIQSAALHEAVGQTAAKAGIDRLASLGRYAHYVVQGARQQGMTNEQLASCDDLDALLTVLNRWTGSANVVLVKGSRSMRMERVSQWLVGRFGSTSSREQRSGKVNCGRRDVTQACA